MMYAALVLLLLVIPCFGQKPSLSQKAGQASSVAADPPHLLDFQNEGPVSGIEATPIMTIPFKCTSSGYTFLHMRDPKKIAEALIFSVHDGKGKRVALSSPLELRNIEIIDFYPTSSTVAFLVRAAKTNKAATHDPQVEERRFFIVETDYEGQHERSIEVPVIYPLFRLAALDAGEFLLSGYDLPEQTLRFLLLDQSGRMIKTIDQPKKIKNAPKTEHPDVGAKDAANEVEANRTMFVSYKDTVLVGRRGTNDPILEVRKGGNVREVRLALPHGQQIADVVPSNTWWLVHAEPDVVSDTEAHDLFAASYFEISPLDGSIVREVRIANQTASVIACEDKNTYRAFSNDKGGKLIQYSAH